MKDRDERDCILIDDEVIYLDEPVNVRVIPEDAATENEFPGGKLTLACGTPFKGETDQKIINYVARLGHMPTPEEVAEEIGCSVSKASRTLSLIKQQMNLAKSRREYFKNQNKD